MDILRNIGGALGISHGNLLKNALKFVGLPDGLAAGIGAVVDLKNGNFGSLLFKTGPEALKALMGGGAGQANSVERPSGIMGMLGKVAGFAALGGVGALGLSALTGGGGIATALGGLGGMMKGILGITAGLGFGALAGGALGGGGIGGQMFGALTGTGGFQTQEARKFTGMTRTDQGPGSMLASLPSPASFEDIIAAFMIDFVKDKQNEIEGKLDKLRKSAESGDGDKAGDKAGGFFGGLLRNIPLVGGLIGGGQDTKKAGSGESRNIEFEMLKNEMQKLSQMQQAMSNVLNEIHTLAMSAIRSIKG
jgi:hypothetical protein